MAIAREKGENKGKRGWSVVRKKKINNLEEVEEGSWNCALVDEED